MNSWYFILNPIAGNGKARTAWEKLSHYLETDGRSFSIFVTESPNSIPDLLPQIIRDGNRQFCIIGGDGTLNQVVNVICNSFMDFVSEFRLTQIPVGTGNDWIKTYGVKMGDPVKFLKELDRGVEYQPYIGQVHLPEKNKTHYFMNITGVGFSGKVVETIYQFPVLKRTGAVGYTLSLLWSLLSFREVDTTISGISKSRSHLFYLSVGMGCYAAGGMKLCPQANPMSGKVQAVVVDRVRRMKVVRNILNLFNGKYLNMTEVQSFITKSIHLRLEQPVPVESDGEHLGRIEELKIDTSKEQITIVMPGQLRLKQKKIEKAPFELKKI